MSQEESVFLVFLDIFVSLQSVTKHPMYLSVDSVVRCPTVFVYLCLSVFPRTELGMSDVSPLSGISRLSFDSTLLSPLLCFLLPLLFLSCFFFFLFFLKHSGSVVLQIMCCHHSIETQEINICVCMRIHSFKQNTSKSSSHLYRQMS